MWKCKHCNKEFDFETTSQKANHTRWCDKNPSREKNKQAVAEAVTKRHNRWFGKYVDFDVECQCCEVTFTVTEREKKHPVKEQYFCSRKCANSTGGKAKAKKYGYSSYRTICLKHHDFKCVVCGEHRLLDVHHVDESKANNDPKNLVLLCATHHRYWHSRYKDLVYQQVVDYVKNKWGT